MSDLKRLKERKEALLRSKGYSINENENQTPDPNSLQKASMHHTQQANVQVNQLVLPNHTQTNSFDSLPVFNSTRTGASLNSLEKFSG